MIALHCAGRPQTAEASAEWLLNCKATGAECLAEQMQRGRQSTDPEVKRLMGELASVRERLARLVLHPQDGPAATTQPALWILPWRLNTLPRTEPP